MLKSQLTTQPYDPTPCHAVLFETLLVSLKGQFGPEATLLSKSWLRTRTSLAISPAGVGIAV